MIGLHRTGAVPPSGPGRHWVTSSQVCEHTDHRSSWAAGENMHTVRGPGHSDQCLE
jgi:hypothetical protein